ncbi:hypothetical protein [Psychrobacter sp. PSP]|uniref:hypothetical protein n=1 Tax=Psychrobacter sp. PSP TaxID=2734636 RepID=UPI0020963938|nr:hypothetical protein [Psychrobacter sp. PSP]
MCNATINKCKTCHLREATEVTGDDHAIKREFERIEQRAKSKEGWDGRVIRTSSHYLKAQTKSPSADTDGL